MKILSAGKRERRGRDPEGKGGGETARGGRSGRREGNGHRLKRGWEKEQLTGSRATNSGHLAKRQPESAEANGAQGGDAAAGKGRLELSEVEVQGIATGGRREACPLARSNSSSYSVYLQLVFQSSILVPVCEVGALEAGRFREAAACDRLERAATPAELPLLWESRERPAGGRPPSQDCGLEKKIF